MSDTAATFYAVPLIGERSAAGALARAVWIAGQGVLQAAGAVAGAGVLIGSVTLAAAWLVNSALVTGPQVQTRAFHGPGTLMLAESEPPPATTRGFESTWARVSTRGVPLMALAARSTNEAAVAVPVPVQVAQLPAIPLPPKRVVPRAPSIPLPMIRPVPAVQEIAEAPAPAASEPTLKVAAKEPSSKEPAKALALKSSPNEAAPQIRPVAPQLAMLTPPAANEDKRALLKPEPKPAAKLAPPSELNSKTAIYDISARTVFLPSGERLEAHSGLYEKMDDPRFVQVRMRGPTPPNVYELTLREQLFHGVRAIRLNPVDDHKMFGRDGILAHTYMLGPSGQSNGCVSFRDYDKFLRAYLRGEIDRLVVVTHGGTQLAAGRGDPVSTGSIRRGRYASAEPSGREERPW